MTTTVMPAAFIGHGSPMNALETNRYTEAWSAFGRSIPRPRAILVVSAHWYINATAVTAMANPRTIHDFFGFPPELFALQYPAPGDPGVAAEVVDVVAPDWVGLDHDSWGIDHGTWSVLVHMFPDADVPVLQLAIDATKPLDEHVALGRRLAPLRERGVLIVGSGNVVHHLGRLDFALEHEGFDWAVAFDDEAQRLMSSDPGAITALSTHDAYRAAVPTPDHFVPLMYIAGLASAAGTTADVLTKGYALGSLSMTSYRVD
jgi:4,5-DOPA dioxygenase extradiol